MLSLRGLPERLCYLILKVDFPAESGARSKVDGGGGGGGWKFIRKYGAVSDGRKLATVKEVKGAGKGAKSGGVGGLSKLGLTPPLGPL